MADQGQHQMLGQDEFVLHLGGQRNAVLYYGFDFRTGIHCDSLTRIPATCNTIYRDSGGWLAVFPVE